MPACPQRAGVQRRRGRWAVLALACLALLLGNTAWAQRFTFETYRQSAGLKNLANTCLIEDREGFLWLCSESGVFQFDGQRFRRHGQAAGLVDNNISAIHEGPDGTLFVLSSHRIYIRRGTRFEEVPFAGQRLEFAVNAQLVTSLDANRLLLVSDNHLLLMARPSAQAAWTLAPVFGAAEQAAVPALGSVHAVHRDAAGTLWLGCGKQICRLPPHSLQAADVQMLGADQGLPASEWLRLFTDKRGRLWARSTEALAMREPGGGAFTRLDPPHAVLTSRGGAPSIAEDAQGRLLVRTDVGLARWTEGRWESFDSSDGLPQAMPSAMLVDRHGAVWLCLWSHGMARWLGYGEWDNWTGEKAAEKADEKVEKKSAPKSGNAGFIWSIRPDATGELLVGSSAGCLRLSPTLLQSRKCAASGLPEKEALSVLSAADGTRYVNFGKQAYRVDARTGRANLIAEEGRIRVMALDAQQRLWLGTRKGALRIAPVDPGAPEGAWQVAEHSPDDGNIGDIALAGQTLWFASTKGLYRLAEGRWTTIEQQGSARDRISSVAPAADGSLWAVTSEGVEHWWISGDRIGQRVLARAPFLEDMGLMFVRTDARGWVWVGTDQGMAVYNGQAWRRLDQTDGLIWNDVDQNAFLADADGSVWIGTSGGLSHLLHPETLQHPAPISAQILSARYATQAIAGDQAALPWAPDGTFEVELVALPAAHAAGANFRYRLRGLGDEWLRASGASVLLPALLPGHYCFEALAFRDNGTPDSAVTRRCFEVVPPWWRTLWFRALVIAAAIAALVLAWRGWTRMLQARHAQLQRLLERATRDPLTRLWNRATIVDQLASELERARTGQTGLALALIDIDHFKQVNDTWGHLAGDEVLRTLGAQLKRMIRQGDAVGRYGGEELMLVMPGLARQHPSAPLERLREQVAGVECQFGGARIAVTASIGVAWLEDNPAADAEQLIARADAALYAAKNAGRNRVVYSPPPAPAANETTAEPVT